MSDIYRMRLHQKIVLENSNDSGEVMNITRVHDGWIYTVRTGTGYAPVFVPSTPANEERGK